MGTTKRERQKTGRYNRLAAAEAAQRRARTRRRAATVGVIVALALGSALLLSLLGGDDDENVSTENTTSTTVPSEEFAYGEGACPPAKGAAKRKTEFAAAPKQCIDPAKKYEARVETTKGTFTITFDTDKAPGTVNNFVTLARYRYFDGVAFHRIIPKFVVQGGDAVGDPPGSGGPGYQIQDELPADVSEYVEGSVAMANSGPDTNGSQFFVWLGPNPLPGPNYSLFGKVTKGLDVVKKLEAAGSEDGTPKEPVKMTKVTIVES